jgi:beta-phosphoglucomutase
VNHPARLKALKGIIFDLDGVLVDTAAFHFQAWKRLAGELGIGFTEHDNEALKGVSRRDSLEHILAMGKVSLSEDEKTARMAQKNGWYLELVNGLTPDAMLPGAKRLLDELRTCGVQIGLGSSSRNAALILQKLNISGYFDGVVDGNKISKSKPDPEVFTLCALHYLHTQPSDTIVVEDARSGVEAARTGGFFCVGIGDLPRADMVISSLEQVNAALLDQALQAYRFV